MERAKTVAIGSRSPSGLVLVLVLLVMAMAASAFPAAAHGDLATGEDHDNPTVGELLLTPIVVGMIHLVAMVALFVMAYRARTMGSLPSPTGGRVPEDAERVFGPYLGDGDRLDHAFRPNKRMYIVSRNLPHFFVLTGLAAFFSIYTYKWLGGNTVFVYTAIHATAIVLLFAHSAMTWRNTWYGVSPEALYKSFGSFSPLAVRMSLRDMDRIEVKQSRLKGMLDVSSLRLWFTKDRVRVDLTMKAIDAPDTIKDVISDAAKNLKTIAS